MHIAYEAKAVLRNLPLQIAAIACHGNREYEIYVDKSLKSFTRKPVQQLVCVPEHQILISLSDNIIHVHEMSHFTEMFSIAKTKGASLFATDIRKISSASGLETHRLKLCVAVKRKIQLFDWRSRSFTEITEIGLADVPRSLAWCSHSIFVGFKRDYYLINNMTSLTSLV
ncbi:Vam6/Vps39-like protein [Holothuria leucospilota]|uniref:Vam6/Vps39-like protein n=1 Tax=Holothuria leucospilota TaxID=206669 RepID=A0A9Q0YPZ1_HOLLE|nr:Vam6/Vps39-like protein [Holothuria leucospilota]